MEHVINYAPGLSRQTQCRSATASYLGVLKIWYARYSQRRALLQLDDRLLDDIGLTRVEALEEARKPFWKD